ncbi:response regulator [Candidatus Marithrix sp. Canyon 246]|nr:response regulator [Candidatus Marithrix sp. Canyon 246]
MIVDRSEVVRSIVSRLLQNQIKNICLITCGSVEEALDYLYQDKFDLITSSLVLPGLDGLDLCHEIRRNKKQYFTPVIMVTSDINQSILHQGFSVGISYFFNKALGYKRLVEFIQEILQRHLGQVGRILFLTDKVNNMQYIIKKHGFLIKYISCGTQALEILKDNSVHEDKFDIVLIDWSLKGKMTNANIIDNIRNKLYYSSQEMPILVIIPANDHSSIVNILHTGANDFISKPVIEEILIARLKSLILVKQQDRILKSCSKKIYNLKTTDGLTGVHNKKYLLEEGKAFITQHPNVCLMMIDIDNFELLDLADEILHLVGQFLLKSFPQEVMISRFAGKKFAALIPDCAFNYGKTLATNLCQDLIKFKPENLEITISIGIASCEAIAETTLNNLITDANAALSEAKKQGNNHISVITT